MYYLHDNFLILQNKMPENQINVWVVNPIAPDQQAKPKIYYHPTWISKIMAWILRAWWFFMVWTWLINLSLLFLNPESIIDVVYCWWGFLLYGIGLLYVWKLFYNNKKWMHLWVSFLLMLLLNIFWSIVFWSYWWEFDDYIEDNYIFWFWFYVQMYFLLVTIIWIIKCIIYKVKWASQKALNPNKDSKKISYITLIFLFIVVIIDIVYWKILYLGIPKGDTSNFIRSAHNKVLDEWEDWIAILKAKENNDEVNNIWYFLDRAYLNRFNVTATKYSESNLTWINHPDECIKVYSWNQVYCWTWAWNENTLKRLFRNQLNEEYVKSDETLEWKTISLYRYLEEREPEIRKEVQELDRLLSTDYYAENWMTNDLLPWNLQCYTRGSIVLIEYYSLKKDWDMVLKLVQIDYKMADITKNFWSFVWVLISNVIEEIIFTNLNNSIQVFPENVRLRIIELIEDNNTDYNEYVSHILEWEYENGNTFINEVSNAYKYDLWLNQILYHFPFYNEADTKRLVYNFYIDYEKYLKNWDKWEFWDFYTKIFDGKSDFRWTIYNIKWILSFTAIAPRLQWGISSIKRTYVHKESLLENLKSWNYDAWYSEPEWKWDSGYYKDNIIE